MVQWQSSDPWVASVSEGTVTAVGVGNARVAAAYGGRIEEKSVSVRISNRTTVAVRVIYAAPSDREFRTDYSEAVAHAAVDLQSWYRRELGGLTFSLFEVPPEFCHMSEPAEYYAAGNAWEKVKAGVQHCAPVMHASSDYRYVIYADVEESCDEPHELGRGGPGLTILHRGDLEGVTSPGPYFHCDEGPYQGTLGRWIGGLGHELGHTLGLPHPEGCDPWDAALCNDVEARSLMHDGYSSYPDTHLLPEDKEILIRSPFIGRQSAPGSDSIYAPNASSVQGAVLGPDGAPLEGLWVSVVAETFWNWGETDPNGAFKISFAEMASGAYILSIHAGDAGDCGWLGYYGPDGLTTTRTQATLIGVGDGNVTGVHVRLPVHSDNLCHEQRRVAGVVLGPDGGPIERIWIGLDASEEWIYTGPDGAFEFSVPEDWSGSTRLRIEVEECGLVGYYGPGGFTTLIEDAALEIGGIGSTAIQIRLAATPDELCRRQTVLAGDVLGPRGEPVMGIGIGLIESTSGGIWPWEWRETKPDGAFEIRLLEGLSGSHIIGIHANKVGVHFPCGHLGFHGPGGFTTLREEATRIELSGADVTGIRITLPARPEELLPARVDGYYCGD